MLARQIGWFILILTAFFNYSCGKIPLEEPGRSVEPFLGDFETGNLSGWHKDYIEEGFSVQVVTNPVRKGTYSAKFTLRPDDYFNKGHRCEISVYDRALYKSETYYAWSFMLDSGYEDSGEWQVVGQWHDMPDFTSGENWFFYPAHSPPVAYYYANGKIALVMSAPDNRNVVIASLDILKGQWYDIVTHVYWSTGNDGYVDTMINGVHITPFNGTDYRYYHPNLYNKAGNYMLIGLYRSPEIKTVNIVYYDEVRIGHSYTEVAP